jgi:hypothetical protein
VGSRPTVEGASRLRLAEYAQEIVAHAAATTVVDDGEVRHLRWLQGALGPTCSTPWS